MVNHVVASDWTNVSDEIVVSKTPLRISFVGGGTDFYDYWKKFQGEVISASIDKYIYVTLKKHGELFNEKIRLNYSKIELVTSVQKIDNLIVKGCFKLLNFNSKIFIGTISDLPSESGLGSSSVFAVGLLNALYASVNKEIGPGDLAKYSNFVELDILKRDMGKQDAYPAAYGGLNLYKFKQDDSVSISPINISADNFNALNSSLCLVFTNQTRKSNTVLNDQIKNTKDNLENLHFIKSQVKDLKDILENSFSLHSIGEVLTEGWLKKRDLSKYISNPDIDSIYKKIMSSGCLGCKLSGAGGGGFFICIVPNEKKNMFKKKLSNLSIIDIHISNFGSKII